MESLIVSPLLQAVFDKLASPRIIRGLRTRRDFQKEIEKLRGKLPIVQAAIEDAEERQHSDARTKAWLAKLKDVAYDANDLLDEISAPVLASQSKMFPSIKRPLEMRPKKVIWDRVKNKVRMISLNKVRKISLTLGSIPNYLRMSRKLKEIRERLDDVAREMSDFQFQVKGVVVSGLPGNGEKRETGPYIVESEVCGRNEDVVKVVEMLLSSNTDVWVIPIVGIGGIGKTTLAQLAYNDERVTRHFDLKIWISLYDDFDLKKITCGMLDYATKHKCDSTSPIGFLQLQLREALCGRRYLLVLDDVWNNDPDEWDKVRNLLGGVVNGSKVVVTTRSHKVASIMSTTPPYCLEALTKDDCWTLFRQRAFPNGDEEDHPNLLPIGKEIVYKCKGVPLAVKVLGSLMRLKREESEWKRVQGTELWDLDGGQNAILSVLKLSFNHLPSHLKQCFAYCAVFPKNYEINKEKLIRQWIAVELIQLPNNAYHGDMVPTLEDIGNDYFNDLLRMSFLEGVSSCDDSITTEFKMHDLIHDLAKSVAGNEFLTLGKTDRRRGPTQSHSMPVVRDGFAKTRHALVDCTFRSCSIPERLYGAKKLHTLNLCSLGYASEKVIKNLVSGFQYLRMLNLSGLGIEKLHKSIGDLICLRYLDLSNTPIEKLPETICHLRKLQTLDLSGCTNLLELPKKMGEMLLLKHLNIKDCARLTRMPPFIGNLKNLQTLPIFIAGQTYEDSMYELFLLGGLRGELKIKHLENLHTLGLSWGDVDEGKLNQYTFRQTGQSHAADAEKVIRLLQPNGGVKKLLINGYPGTRFPSWMNLVMLRNLTQLELINCRRCESLPPLGHLPGLKVLHIQGMDSVLNIGSEFFGDSTRCFLLLNELSLRDFPSLKNWESIDSMEAFTCLNRLTIVNCPCFVTMPCFPSLRHLEMRNCDPLLLRSAAQLRSLSTLVIDNFPELLFIPKALLENNSLLLSLTVFSCPRLCSMPENFGKLRALKALKIGWCQELEALPHGLTNLTSLETLEIIECPGLVSLPEKSQERLSSLRSLSIENCHGLTSLPIGMQHTTALERLTIMYCSSLTSLPDSLQHLFALKSLTILSCTSLESLPNGLQFATTLQNLELHGCLKLMELPEWVGNLISLRSLAISDCNNIKSLPKGLQLLSALQHLSVRDCPDLEKRCEREKGADWEKIFHTPYIYIGSSALQQRHDIASSSSSL